MGLVLKLRRKHFDLIMNARVYIKSIKGAMNSRPHFLVRSKVSQLMDGGRKWFIVTLVTIVMVIVQVVYDLQPQNGSTHDSTM